MRPLPITIREIRPSDAEELAAGLPLLSLATRYRRFHAAIDRLTPAQWRYLTEVDGTNHVAFVACLAEAIEGAPAGPVGKIVGVARFIRSTENPAAAEVAFVVFDEVHGRGVGSQLCERLIDAALARGISTFLAHVLTDNTAIRRLLRRDRLTAIRERTFGVLEVGIVAAPNQRLRAS